MAEVNVSKTPGRFAVRHRERGAQVLIYLGKLLRMFIYQSDWKVLPMAALIAGLVGMVVRKRFFINMEGTLMGAFAIVCVCIWNGCFNSIQVICRERDVIKREHRSGMHISSYIFSHMLYQALLCLAQTAVTVWVTIQVGVQYPQEGMVTGVFLVDFGISMFLITYASDMLSLWVSTLARSTTTAMTIMPFVLIFQLVFSGGMMTLPAWTYHLTPFTISNPGLKVVAAQADINHRPYATIADMVGKMRDNEISATVSVGDALDYLQDDSIPVIAELRAVEIGKVMTVGELKEWLESSPSYARLREENAVQGMTLADLVQSITESDQMQRLSELPVDDQGTSVGDLFRILRDSEDAQMMLGAYTLVKDTTVGEVLDALNISGVMEEYKDKEIGRITTIGAAIDWLAGIGEVQAARDRSFTVSTTVGKLLDVVGEERVKTFLEQKAAAASYNAAYENTVPNVVGYWLHLSTFIIGFALLATITLEFIDKDKR